MARGQCLEGCRMAVSVIWSKSGQHLVDYENIDGIIVYQHSLPFEARGNAVLLIEYTVAILHEAYLLPKILSRADSYGCDMPRQMPRCSAAIASTAPAVRQLA
jgi:hypothetical protein